MEYNVYCDESCHLISNNNKYMLIGTLSYCYRNLFEILQNKIL